MLLAQILMVVGFGCAAVALVILVLQAIAGRNATHTSPERDRRP